MSVDVAAALQATQGFKDLRDIDHDLASELLARAHACESASDFEKSECFKKLRRAHPELVKTISKDLPDRISELGAAAAGAAAGVAGVAGAKVLAAALVPSAMSFFGTVVPGIGTIHASAAAGGVAANLQVVAAVSLGPVGWLAVAAVGAGAAVLAAKHINDRRKKNEEKQR